MLQTLQWALPALKNVLFLTIVIYGTSALLGCYLYMSYKTITKTNYTYYVIG